MKSLEKVLKGILIATISLISIMPFYVLILLSLSSPSSIISKGNILIKEFYYKNYIDAWRISKLGTSILNSIIITAGSIFLIVILSSSAGYTIARYKSKFNSTIFYIFLICMMIPGIINTVPLYTLMRTINGINTHWAMILVCTTNALPFSIFLYVGFVKTLPVEIEEAAIIDGCTRFLAFIKVVFPLLKPVTSAVVIINGLSIWNNYAQAVFFLQNQSMRTIPLSISIFFQQYGAKWNLMAAAAVIGVAPAVITFLVFQKYFIKGIAAGSVKG